MGLIALTSAMSFWLIACKKTAAWKKEIVESRTLSSKLIVNTLQQHPHSIKAVISASAIGWYGPDPFLPTGKESEGFNEEAKPDGHFLGETCRLWEESIEPVTAMGIRLVRFRTGIVLSNEGGAFPEFKKTLRNGIAAVLGNGKQVISWIHLEDLCRLYLYAIENEIPGGPYNVVAPAPVTNKTFILKLAGAMRGRFFIPLNVPVFLLKLILGKRSIEVLKSATVSAGRIKETGFVFLYPSIDAALKELIPKK